MKYDRTQTTEQIFRASYYHHSEAVCEKCNKTLDLSEADSLKEAKRIRRRHIEEEHAKENVEDRNKRKIQTDG